MKTPVGTTSKKELEITRFINKTTRFLKNLPRINNSTYKQLKNKLNAKLNRLTENHIFLIESNHYNRKAFKSYKMHQLLLNKSINKSINTITSTPVSTPKPIPQVYSQLSTANIAVVHHEFELPYWNVENINEDISENIAINALNSADNSNDMRLTNSKLQPAFIKYTECHKLLTTMLNPNEYLFQQYFVELKQTYHRLNRFIADCQITIERAIELLNANYSYNIYVKKAMTFYLLFQTKSNKLGYAIANLSICNSAGLNIYIDTPVQLQNIGVQYNLLIEREKYSLAIFNKRSSLDYILGHIEKLNENTKKIVNLNVVKYHDYVDTL